MMKNTSKIAIGLGLVSSAFLATWLVTGDRKNKTREFIAKKVNDVKRSMQKKVESLDDSETLYI